MDRQAASRLIEDTFNYPFDEGRYRHFVLNLLNDVDEQDGFFLKGGNFVKNSFKPHVNKYRRLGTYTDPNGESVDILVVQLKNEWALERSRTMLRNFTADYLKSRDEKDAALVAYYTTNPDDWRFSYIKLEYRLEKSDSGKIKVKEEVTSAKRFSFLVGKNEPNHTAQAQLVSILLDDQNNPTLSKLESAFSVEGVSKQFYKDYRRLYETLNRELASIVEYDQKIAGEFKANSIETANFAKKTMGQIVFLYFLQKKGWLGVGKDIKGNFNLWGAGPKNFLRRLFDKEYTSYGNFFNEVLEPLLYVGLASEREDDLFPFLNCKVPFLSGGLFEPMNQYNWQETDILIPNDVIKEILDTFDRYNFTVREDEPLETEVAVDPEMLGKVFENLIGENERKGKGAFYTPRTIVHYMCQESLINFLDTNCEPVPKDDIETLVREGDVILELETAIQDGTRSYKSVLMDTIKDNASSLDNALADIKICDPAVGSGAFPVGMMTEIIKARRVLSLYLEQDHSIYELKRHCIQESLYGVDLDPGAIDIAKLRLWLSLVVDEEDYKSIHTLPNLDYKIMQGNSLIEEFHGISLDVKKKPGHQFEISSDGNQFDSLIEDLQHKQAEFFNAEHPKEKKKKRKSLEDAIFNIFHHELEKKKTIPSVEVEAIEVDLREMTIGSQVRNFFPWKLYFANVFREKGGFDIVIGNPPYIDSEGMVKMGLKTERDLIARNYSLTRGNWDIYIAFFELGFNCLNVNGILTFISPDKWISKPFGDKLREYSFDKIISVLKAGRTVFETAKVDSIVSIFGNRESDTMRLKTLDNSRVVDLNSLQKSVLSPPFAFDFLFSKHLNILLKFEECPQAFRDYSLCENACATSDAYKLKPFIKNKPNSHTKHLNHLKLINTGTIGKYLPKWGIKEITYLGEKYLHPVVDQQSFKNSFKGSYSKKVGSPKIIIKGLNLLDACVDEDGSIIPGKTTLVITNNSSTILKYLLGILNSKAMVFYIREKYPASSYNKGITFTKAMINNFPLPSISEKDQKFIVKLINNILTRKRANRQVDTTAIESKIDSLVYELYGLTDDEIATVEGGA